MTDMSELLDHLRIEVLRDVPQPHLYTEDALVRALNEAYQKFARHTHLFVDEQSLTLTAGERFYPLPTQPRTLFVRQVLYNDRYLTPFTRRGKPKQFSGPPAAYSTDTRYKHIRIYPEPDAAYEIDIVRAYAPEQVSSTGVFDLPYEWALLLTDWAAYRVLVNNDPDATAAVSPEPFLNAWLAGLRSAKQEVIRMAMGDNPSAQPRSWT